MVSALAALNAAVVQEAPLPEQECALRWMLALPRVLMPAVAGRSDHASEAAEARKAATQRAKSVLQLVDSGDYLNIVDK
eukprot:12897278-Alexandrium_andersonii.AAC.1